MPLLNAHATPFNYRTLEPGTTHTTRWLLFACGHAYDTRAAPWKLVARWTPDDTTLVMSACPAPHTPADLERLGTLANCHLLEAPYVLPQH